MKHGFFEDNTGNSSSTRLRSFISAMVAFLIATASVFMKDITLGDSWPMVITLLGYSLGEKSFQYALDKSNKK